MVKPLDEVVLVKMLILLWWENMALTHSLKKIKMYTLGE